MTLFNTVLLSKPRCPTSSVPFSDFKTKILYEFLIFLFILPVCLPVHLLFLHFMSLKTYGQ